MKAKKKTIEKISLNDLGVDLTPRLETLKVTEPPKRQGGAKVDVSMRTTFQGFSDASYEQVADVDELYAKLKEAGFAPS